MGRSLCRDPGKEDKGQGVEGCQVKEAQGISSPTTRYDWLEVEGQGGKRVCPSEHNQKAEGDAAVVQTRSH